MKYFKFNEKIYSCEFKDGTFIWPIFRYQIISSLMQNGVTQSSNVKKNNRFITALNIIKGLAFIRFKKKNIIYISDDGDNVLNGDEYKNKIHHDQYFQFPDKSMVYESSGMSFNYKNPKSIPNVSNLFDYLRLIIHFGSFFSKNKSKNDDIECFLQYVSEAGYENIETLRYALYNFSRKVTIARWVYRVFLKLSMPKIIIVNSASYGSLLALLINEAKKMGIKTAEMQHGYISENHPAYSFYDAELRAGYKAYFPDDLLTFGQLWSDSVSFINNKKVIGYDYLNSKCLEYKKSQQGTTADILFISQWTITAELVQLCLEIKAKYPEKRIEYRLHPVENLTLEQKMQLKYASVRVMRPSDIELYDHLGRSKIVIGGYSTVLYEALALNKIVYQFETAFSNSDSALSVLDTFTSVDELQLDINNSFNVSIRSQLWHRESNSAFYKYVHKFTRGE